jgi:predicted nucleotidyltransferase
VRDALRRARLTRKEQSALRRFREAVEKALGATLVEMKLFGSKARGDARKDSDLDVLVVASSADWRLRDTVTDIATDILLDENVCISPKVISTKHYQYLQATGSPFIRNVGQEGVSL